MGLFLSTTGTNVELDELGFTLNHPSIEYELSAQFSSEEIKESVTLTTAIRTGVLTWRKELGGLDQPSVDYDPDFLDLENENTGDGLKDDRAVLFRDLNELVANSASPGFSFGRGGNVAGGGWLANETVPSNISGRYVYINNAIIEKVFVSSQEVGTYTVGIYWHDGDEVNLTKLGEVTVTEARGGAFTVHWPVPVDTQLACVVEAGAIKNPVAGLQLSGTNS